LRPFDYVAAASIEEAFRLLSENTPEAVPIAGGTDLLVRMKNRTVQPGLLVDIARIPELAGIALTAEGLRIGAMATHAEVLRSELVRRHAPAVAAACASVGSVQTRSLGTIGGNLVSCVPSLDCAPPLLVLDALVTVADAGGVRRLPLGEFFVSPRCSLLTPEQLLVDILIPSAELGKSSCFQKFGRRKALTLALVNAAACVELEPDGERFARVRLALGAVAPTPLQAKAAEIWLAGRACTAEAIAEAGRIAAGEAKPIDDFRASADYRRELVRTLSGRAITAAVEALKGGRACPPSASR
jgi:carbon-monoxide dehydrogenase medium subunit